MWRTHAHTVNKDGWKWYKSNNWMFSVNRPHSDCVNLEYERTREMMWSGQFELGVRSIFESNAWPPPYLPILSDSKRHVITRLCINPSLRVICPMYHTAWCCSNDSRPAMSHFRSMSRALPQRRHVTQPNTRKLWLDGRLHGHGYFIQQRRLFVLRHSRMTKVDWSN